MGERKHSERRTPLHIAHVLPAFQLGGQERVALDLAIGQKAAGCQVHCVSLAGIHGPFVKDFTGRGIEVHGVAKFPERFGFDVSLSLRLAHLFRREKIDVVHTHNPQPLIYAAPAAKLAGAAAVHTRHGENLDPWRRRVLRRTAARFADRYVAVSPGTAERTRRDGDVAEGKLSVIPNGINLSRFHPDPRARQAIRRELQIPEDAWVVGTVGRTAPEKAHALLIDVMAPRLGDRERLVIVGDGPEAAALRKKVELLPAGRFVHLLGSRSDVPHLLCAFDVFALTSREEGMPLAVLEAMATGLPVVSTRVGGIPDVVSEGEVGHLVPSGDEAALRNRLKDLAERRHQARALGERGRALALAEYSSARMVQSYFELYDGVCGRT